MTDRAMSSAERHLLGLIDGTLNPSAQMEGYPVSGLGEESLRAIARATEASDRATIHRPTWSALRVGESGLHLTTVIRDEEE